MKIRYVLILGIAVGAFADPIEWHLEDSGNGHSYDLIGNYNDFSQRWSWETCRLTALGLGGHLATITSDEENQFVISTAMGTNSLPTWIGLTDSPVYGGHDSYGLPNPQTNGWLWVTGEPVEFTFWQSGQPDREQLNQNSAAIGSYLERTFRWDNFQGSDHAQFLVEFDKLASRFGTNGVEIIWPQFSTNGCTLEWSENLRDWHEEGFFASSGKLAVHHPKIEAPFRFYRLRIQ